jgi:hypothetical protein
LTDANLLDEQHFALEPTDLTGNLALRLHYDDSLNRMVGSFSLDGGGTFQTPFASVSSTSLEGRLVLVSGERGMSRWG